MRNYDLISKLNEYPNHRIFMSINGDLIEMNKVISITVVEKHHVLDRFRESKVKWEPSDELGSFEVIVLYD